MIGHNGGQPRVGTITVSLPGRRVEVAILCNPECDGLRKLAIVIARMVSS